MKDFILNWLAEQILKSIEDEKIEALALKLKALAIPYLHEKKDELIALLREKAKATSSKVDDQVVHALDVFLTSLIPSEAQLVLPVVHPGE